MNALKPYCVNCHEEHESTAACVVCEFDIGFLHEPMPEDIYFDFKGWRFRPPFLCINCGRTICFRQWAFCRGCGRCDVGKGPQSIGWFAGPHELIDPNADYFLKPERFVEASRGPLPYPKTAITPNPKPT